MRNIIYYKGAGYIAGNNPTTPQYVKKYYNHTKDYIIKNKIFDGDMDDIKYIIGDTYFNFDKKLFIFEVFVEKENKWKVFEALLNKKLNVIDFKRRK